MSNIIKFIVSAAFMLVVENGNVYANYELGIFGYPGNRYLDELVKAGLSSIIFRKFEFDDILIDKYTKRRAVDVIYYPGYKQKDIEAQKEESLVQSIRDIENKMKVDGVYIVDDLNCRYYNKIENVLKGLRNISTRMLYGTNWRSKCYRNIGADLFIYYYPAMRFEERIQDIYRNIIFKIEESRDNGKTNALLFTQAHYQNWYDALLECGNYTFCRGRLYPDGQIIRLIFFLNITSGAKGLYIYNAKRLRGVEEEEKRLTLLQVMRETKILRKYLDNIKRARYFESSENIYGSILSFDNHEITSYFKAGRYTMVHPSIAKKRIQFINNDKYYYNKWCWDPITDNRYMTEAEPFITINVKPKDNDLCHGAELDKEIEYLLKKRIDLLQKYVGIINTSVENLSLEEKYAKVEMLNEIKREEWMAKSRKEYEGSKMNTEFWVFKKNRNIRKYINKYQRYLGELNYYTVRHTNVCKDFGRGRSAMQ